MNNKEFNFKIDFKNIRNYMGEFLTAIIALALIVYSFVALGFRDSIDEYWITTFIIGFIIMIVITSVWYPNAKQKAQYTDEGYILQRTEYGKLVDKVTNANNQKNLNKFCDWATEQNRLHIIRQKLLKKGIDFELWVKYSKTPSKVQEEKELTDKQKIYLKALIENGVNVKIINYQHILTGLKNGKLKYDTNSTETRYDTITLTLKVFVSVCSAVVMAFLVFSVGGFTWASIANLLMWYVLIVWNMFTSYSTGYKSISIHRTGYYSKLRTFLEEFVSSEFYEDKKISVDAVIREMAKQEINKTEAV